MSNNSTCEWCNDAQMPDWRESPVRLYYEANRVRELTPSGTDMEIFRDHLIARDIDGNPYIVGELERIEQRGLSKCFGFNYYFKNTGVSISDLLNNQYILV